MSVQTVIFQDTREALPGLPADLNPMEKISAINTQGENLGFGIPVVRDTAASDRSAKRPAAPTDEFDGVTIRVLDRPTTSIGGDFTSYIPLDVMSLMREGRIFVTCSTACTAGDSVFYVAEGVNVGDWRNVLGVAPNATTELTNATWESTNVTPGEIAVLRIVPKPQSV